MGHGAGGRTSVTAAIVEQKVNVFSSPLDIHHFFQLEPMREAFIGGKTGDRWPGDFDRINRMPDDIPHHQIHRSARGHKKILQHLGLWEESHAPPDRGPPEKEITFDPSYSQII